MSSNIINVTVQGLRTADIPAIFKTVVLKSNIGFAEQLTQEYTKYVIKWNYDLSGGSIDVPAYCIFDFDGGQLQHGTINWNNTKVLNLYQYEILHDITETGNKIIL